MDTQIDQHEAERLDKLQQFRAIVRQEALTTTTIYLVSWICFGLLTLVPNYNSTSSTFYHIIGGVLGLGWLGTLIWVAHKSLYWITIFDMLAQSEFEDERELGRRGRAIVFVPAFIFTACGLILIVAFFFTGTSLKEKEKMEELLSRNLSNLT
jgi:hypothetical protein